MTNSVEITRIINDAKDGVDSSAFGPLFPTNPNDIAKKNINTFAWSFYGMVLEAMLQEVIKHGNKIEK